MSVTKASAIVANTLPCTQGVITHPQWLLHRCRQLQGGCGQPLAPQKRCSTMELQSATRLAQTPCAQGGVGSPPFAARRLPTTSNGLPVFSILSGSFLVANTSVTVAPTTIVMHAHYEIYVSRWLVMSQVCSWR